MHSRCRSALLWLLLLALPLQGFAAAAMLHCGPSHHRLLAATEAPAHAVTGHHHQGHDAGPVHAHADAGAHDLDKLSKFKCTACAACCMGAAMPTAALFIPALPPADALAAAVFAAHADFLPSGLDRPPRISLA